MISSIHAICGRSGHYARSQAYASGIRDVLVRFHRLASTLCERAGLIACPSQATSATESDATTALFSRCIAPVFRRRSSTHLAVTSVYRSRWRRGEPASRQRTQLAVRRLPRGLRPARLRLQGRQRPFRARAPHLQHARGDSSSTYREGEGDHLKRPRHLR